MAFDDEEDFFEDDYGYEDQSREWSYPGTEFDNLPFFREPEIEEEVEQKVEERRREEEAVPERLDASPPTDYAADPYRDPYFMGSSGPQGLMAPPQQPQLPPDWSNADEKALANTMNEMDQIKERAKNQEIHPFEAADELSKVNAERQPLLARRQAWMDTQEQQAEQKAHQQLLKQNALLTSMQQKNAVVDTEIFDRKYKSVVDPETGRFVHFYQPEPGKWAQVKTEGAPQEATIGREEAPPGRDVPADGKFHQVAPNVAVSAGQPRQPSVDELRQDYMRLAGPYRIANGERNFEEAARLKPAHDAAFAKWQQAERTQQWNNRYLGDPAAGFQQTESQKAVGEIYKSGRVPDGRLYQDALEDLQLQKEGIDPRMVKPSRTEQAINERRAATIAAPGTRQYGIALQSLNDATIRQKQAAARQEAIMDRQIKAEQFKLEQEQRKEQSKLDAENRRTQRSATARFQIERTKQHKEIQDEIDKLRTKEDESGKKVPMTEKEFAAFAAKNDLPWYLLTPEAHRAEAERRALAATVEAYPDWQPKQKQAEQPEQSKPAERTGEQIQAQSERVNRILARMPSDMQKEAAPIVREIERVASAHPQGIQSARQDVQEYATKLRSQLAEIEARHRRDLEPRIAEAEQMPIPWDKVPMESFGAP